MAVARKNEYVFRIWRRIAAGRREQKNRSCAGYLIRLLGKKRRNDTGRTRVVTSTWIGKVVVVTGVCIYIRIGTGVLDTFLTGDFFWPLPGTELNATAETRPCAITKLSFTQTA